MKRQLLPKPLPSQPTDTADRLPRQRAAGAGRDAAVVGALAAQHTGAVQLVRAGAQRVLEAADRVERKDWPQRKREESTHTHTYVLITGFRYLTRRSWSDWPADPVRCAIGHSISTSGSGPSQQPDRVDRSSAAQRNVAIAIANSALTFALSGAQGCRVLDCDVRIGRL